MFSIPDFLKAKQAGKKIAMLTAYDAYSARCAEEAGIDAVLVGDSVSMVVHGFSTTLQASMDMMALHTAAVRRGAPDLCVIADMPFMSTRTGLRDACRNAGSLVRAGANGIKLEGRAGHEKLIRHLIASGIPVMGHLGLQPQSLNRSGGYKLAGRGAGEADAILEDALALQDCGTFALVLECVPCELGERVAAKLAIPVIGIGAGAGTDGQILVMQDMLGFNEKTARFVRRYMDGNSLYREAFTRYLDDVRAGIFPSKQESY